MEIESLKWKHTVVMRITAIGYPGQSVIIFQDKVDNCLQDFFVADDFTHVGHQVYAFGFAIMFLQSGAQMHEDC